MTDSRRGDDHGTEGRPGRLKLIACSAVLGEFEEGAADGVDCETLEAQLHLSPERLKEALRAAVAAVEKPGAMIVLGYGLCSNAVLDLRTEHATLVVPRVDDCIATMLGSNEAFAAQSEKARGTYYLTKAYLEECDTILSDYEKLVEKRVYRVNFLGHSRPQIGGDPGRPQGAGAGPGSRAA